ncbi:sigma-70 family RNA polymerase sigma factor [Bacillus yapensis]|uniref:sigma-70 family RNA polymerase sigma factor n=1 Tax=Bacillus yapensis TaxID=2492960 RepID=UPI002482B150|nr:sigma-70 family RNA polymerase sigma factor [Bacillus yapensis]
MEKKYEAMIWKIIHSLHIYKNQQEFYQTGLIALWEAHNGFDKNKGNFTSYAFAFIRGKIMTELTSRKKLEDRTIFPEEEFWYHIEDDSVNPLLEGETILSYCGRLTEHQKKWVLYTALADLSIKEIAEIEQVSVSAVKAWKRGARKKIIENIQTLE